ncbi:hypothetical protein L1887_58239 [Cichorium endivia]|nr:hypothetical protein L1887_58239 [Cichorium endivia]
MAQLTARSCRSWKRARRPATAAPNLAWSCNALCCAVQDDPRRPLRLRRSAAAQPWTMGLPEDSFPSARWSAEGVNLEEARPIAVAGCFAAKLHGPLTAGIGEGSFIYFQGADSANSGTDARTVHPAMLDGGAELRAITDPQDASDASGSVVTMAAALPVWWKKGERKKQEHENPSVHHGVPGLRDASTHHRGWPLAVIQYRIADCDPFEKRIASMRMPSLSLLAPPRLRWHASERAPKAPHGNR